MKTYKLPYSFIRDCLESDVDIGEYDKGKLTATDEQLANLKDRARYYADGDVDQASRSLITAAKRLLVALEEN